MRRYAVPMFVLGVAVVFVAGCSSPAKQDGIPAGRSTDRRAEADGSPASYSAAASAWRRGPLEEQVFDLEIHPDLPRYVVRASFQRFGDHDGLVRRLEVFRGNRRVQRLDAVWVQDRREEMTVWDSRPEEPWLTTEDVNFDGYQDLKIRSIIGSADGNTTYYYLLFDAGTVRFREQAWVLTRPDLDPLTATVRTRAGTVLGEEVTYAVRGYALVPLHARRLELDQAGEVVWEVTEEFRHGEWILISREPLE